MPYLAVDKDGTEWIYDVKPRRINQTGEWQLGSPCTRSYRLPKGSILRLAGRTVRWSHKPVEITEETLTPKTP